MSRAIQVANIARQDPLHTTIQRELGQNIRPIFTRTKLGHWWCELKLSEYRFTHNWVCCPGETKEKALANAIRNAKRKVRVTAWM